MIAKTYNKIYGSPSSESFYAFVVCGITTCLQSDVHDNHSTCMWLFDPLFSEISGATYSAYVECSRQ